MKNAPFFRFAVLAAAAALSVASAASAGSAPVARFDAFSYRGHDAVYDPLIRDSDTYFNPIRSGFYPDPSIVRVDQDYYLVNSTFAFFPGLPIFHSTDLVHWVQIGNAIDRPSQIDFGKVAMSRGLYAPAIEHHRDTFYILNTCVDCGGNFLITAKNATGPWSDPIYLPFGGIDPSLFFDPNGKVYVVYNDAPEGAPLYEGHRAIWMQQIDVASGKLIGPRKVIVNGGTDIAKKPIWIEGPHVFKKDGWYYLICAEGGTAEQHSEVVFRSKAVWGPYEPYADNPILTQRDLPADRPHPVTSTGHAQFVTAPDGAWWAVFLGTRPYAGDLYNIGRETFLLPVTWTDGWPVILPKGQAVPYQHVRPQPVDDPSPVIEAGTFSYPDNFAGTALGPQWLFVRTPKEPWYTLSERTLNVTARPVAIGGFGQPSFVGRRQQHGDAEVSIGLRFAPEIEGARAGLVAFQNDNAFYFLGLVRQGGKTALCVSRRASASEPENGTTLTCADAPADKVWLKMAIRGATVDFYSSADGETWTTLLAGADATILSTHKAGGFVGTVIGPYAYAP